MKSIDADARAVDLDPTQAGFPSGFTLDRLGTTHFIGIGGAGMSVLAEMLLQRGVTVTGSDTASGPRTERLASLGADVAIGQDARNVDGASTVVYSSAVRPDNPEIRAAAKTGLRIVHRSDILALLMSDRRSVTVAGTHGKTTTSSLIAHILRFAGTGDLADPGYAIGGTIQGPDGTTLDGGHAGSGAVLVAEADESDGSFAKYRPDIAVITNAESDHLDHYGTVERYREAFVDYARHARGTIVICADDEGALQVLRALGADTAARAIAYSTRPAGEVGDLNGARLVSIESEEESAGSGRERFTVRMPAGSVGEDPIEMRVALRIAGIHNARNAAAALVVAVVLGVDPEKGAQAAGTFLGASRRFELRGTVKQVSVFDDYAHHPTEVAALLSAARRRFPNSTIRVLFQPHLFSRTRFFASAFARALSIADDVLVTGVYPARESQKDFPDVTASTIVDAAAGIDHDPARWIEAVEDMHVAAQMLAMRSHHGDVILTVGAGDVTRMGPVILHVLETHRASCEG
ncbi:UDP-N-acetylmuramate--L-alanine ligase [uncultured Bifidobacterium sp.]|uniref:UDP-N-acetylmuramate--L-alanine ligase n=1 Tax=uncultured Bifidobacterium sp. TaxID=165187 RepID=UPI0028DB887B|nr:UDP-N-acetylmuramate--L-alanine ligase [uncultured Bifidobacterium sp.]